MYFYVILHKINIRPSGCKFCLSSEYFFILVFYLSSIQFAFQTLEVSHHDYIEGEDKVITVTVLDCDTITQVKNKMLENFYKNVGYSQRPKVHATVLG